MAQKLGRNKILVSYKLNEDLVNMFRSTCAFNGITMSEIVEEAIKRYVVKNKEGVDTKMKEFFEVKK
jgi:hypothetical protein